MRVNGLTCLGLTLLVFTAFVLLVVAGSPDSDNDF